MIITIIMNCKFYFLNVYTVYEQHYNILHNMYCIGIIGIIIGIGRV